MRYWFYFSVYCIAIASCRSNQHRELTSTDSLPVTNASVTMEDSDSLAVQAIDTSFLRFFENFKEVVLLKDRSKLTKMVHFPLRTGKKWSNEELTDAPGLALEGIIGKQAFEELYGSIFTDDVLTLLQAATTENIDIIMGTTDESYYQQLFSQMDKGTPIYEAYFQYPERNGTAESYFAFDFGIVNGKYKLISYYAKWPVSE